jgi:hypothetical protein
MSTNVCLITMDHFTINLIDTSMELPAREIRYQKRISRLRGDAIVHAHATAFIRVGGCCFNQRLFSC